MTKIKIALLIVLIASLAANYIVDNFIVAYYTKDTHTIDLQTGGEDGMPNVILELTINR